MKSIHELPVDTDAHAALLRALDGPHLLVGLYDPADHLTFANANFRTSFALDDVSGRMTFADLILHSVLRRRGPRIESGGAVEFIAETQMRRRGVPGQRTFAADLADGRWYWVTETLLESGWIVVIGSEISSLRHGEEALIAARDLAMQEARTDALTGLPNRRHTLSYLELAISAFVCAKVPLTVALIDLDHFKLINDRYGHAAGDAVLRDFADVSREAVRQSDLMGRIGGEEFMAIFSGASVDDAVAAIERMRRNVGERRVRVGDHECLAYSFSSGICRVEATDDVQSALARADRALYAAKRAGRNRVVSFAQEA